MSQPIQSFQQVVIEPEIDVDTRWWWDALGEGRLELPQCQSCSRSFFPPQPSCSHCGSTAWKRIQSTGKGRIYSWVVVHKALDPLFAKEVPYPIVAVELEEGVRLIGRYRGDTNALREDAPVRTFIYRIETTHLLGFECAEDSDIRVTKR